MAERRYTQRRFELPAGAVEVVLVRHGASQPAVPGEPFPDRDGHADPALDPTGHAQAHAVSRRLAGPGHDPVDAIFTTGLTRTEETAAPTAAALGLTPTPIHELREVHLGEWEGGEFRIRMQNADPTALRVLQEERWDVIPGAESAASISARVRAGIERIVAAVAGGEHRRAIAFVHSGIVGEACREAAASRPFAFVHAENTSISRIVVYADGRWLLRAFNEVAHLDVPHEPA